MTADLDPIEEADAWQDSLTDPGWPRPLNEAGLPVPWISPPLSLGKTDPTRRKAAVEDGLCQVCGIGHATTDTVYAFVTERRGGGAVEHPDRPGVLLALALDNAVMHHRCMRLTLGRCGGLEHLRAGGPFLVMHGALSDIEPVWVRGRARTWATTDDDPPELRLGIDWSLFDVVPQQ